VNLPLPGAPRLDNVSHLETPEGIDLLLRPAGPLPRALALLFDLLLRGLLLALLAVVLFFLGGLGKGLITILAFVISWGYPILFEVLCQGQTPGKKLMGLYVVHDDGTPIGWPSSITRNLLRAADMLPVGYGLGLVACLLQKQFKRLGDLAAGTLVVYRPLPAKNRPELPKAAPLRLPFVLAVDEQRAVLDFAERHQQLSSARRAELAAIVAPVLNVDEAQAEQQLHRLARGLLESA